MRKIIYTRLDGGLSVVHPVLNTRGEVPGFTEADAEARAWAKLPANAINPRWADDTEVPSDRTFRNAWEDSGVVSVNMTKARELHRTRLRELRKPRMESLDVAFMRALEIGDEVAKAAIILQKQVLRDVTADPAIETARTPEELKTVLPDAVK